jgi:ribokinase
MLLVFGSINLDLAFRAPHLPAPGETVLGHGLLVSPGGKGANQAHAARRYGMPTALAGAVGQDAFAAPALAALKAAGVNLSALQSLPGATGCASIAVDDAGQNQIVVAPGVNLALRADAVPDALLASAQAVLLQMETDPAQNLALLKRACGAGRLTLLNNAPAQALAPELLDLLDVLIVNEGEADLTARSAGLDAGEREAALNELALRHGLTVVLTLGAAGAVALDGRQRQAVAALPVPVMDTTGAGDTFSGVLAAALIEGHLLHEAMRRASVAAGLACTRPGAQAAQPARAEIDAAL